MDLHVEVIKGGMNKYRIFENPGFKPGPVEPRFSEYLVFEGISVDEHSGQQHYLDAHVAYRRTCLKFQNIVSHIKSSTLGVELAKPGNRLLQFIHATHFKLQRCGYCLKKCASAVAVNC